MKKNTLDSIDPLAEDFEEILSSVYAQNQKSRPLMSTTLGRPLTVVAAATALPDNNIGAMAFDLYESVQTFPPVLLHTSDIRDIYVNGVKWLVEELLQNEELQIFIPHRDILSLRLPEINRVSFAAAPVDDPEILALMARATHHIQKWLRHCDGEAVGTIELPPCPDPTKSPVDWFLYSTQECKDAGLDAGETNHEILKRISRPLSEEEAAILTGKVGQQPQ